MGMKPGDILIWGVVAVALVACGVALGYTIWGQQATAPATPTPVPMTPVASTVPTAEPTPPQSPVGSWLLTSMTGVKDGSSFVQMPSGEITAIFTTDGKVQGSGGCNSYGGNYATSGPSIAVTGLASTLMSCGNVLDTQERAYLAILGASSTFETSGGMLTIRTNQTPPSKLVFQARAP